MANAGWSTRAKGQGRKLDQARGWKAWMLQRLRSLMSVDINVNWARAAIVLSKEAAPPSHSRQVARVSKEAVAVAGAGAGAVCSGSGSPDLYA